MAGQLSIYTGVVSQTISALILAANKTFRWNGTANVLVSGVSDAAWATGLIAMTENVNSDSTHTGMYVGNVPALPAGDYVVLYYLGATPAAGDAVLGTQSFVWDGTQEVTSALTSQLGVAGAAAFIAAANSMKVGTVTNASLSPTTTVFQSADITEAAANHWVGATLIFTSGALIRQRAVISAYSLVGGKGQFTVPALTSAPANGVSFILV